MQFSLLSIAVELVEYYSPTGRLIVVCVCCFCVCHGCHLFSLLPLPLIAISCRCCHLSVVNRGQRSFDRHLPLPQPFASATADAVCL